MDRLTLDMTAIRDIVDAGRPRHTQAVKLLEAAENGHVELAIPPQGSLADLRGQFGAHLAEQIRGLLSRAGMVELQQIARLSDVTFPSDTLFPGHYVKGFDEAWALVASTWNGPGRCPQAFDRWYVESHLIDSRDVLITDDQGLKTMCDRLRAEHGFTVRAEGLTKYVAAMA